MFSVNSALYAGFGHLHLTRQVLLMVICWWCIMSICSDKVVRDGGRGSGLAQSCSGWRSSLPVGSSSSLRFSAAARFSPELSAAGCSPHTGH